MVSYIRQLQREIDASAHTAEPITADLRQRVITWFNSQPEVSRNRRYAMSELEQALGAPGRLLSAALTDLGWKRGRQWSSIGPNPRYWVPPDR